MAIWQSPPGQDNALVLSFFLTIMSRQPSPGGMAAAPSAHQMGRMQFKAKAHHAGGGLTQGAEDAKYHQKYKELKRNVKEIESVRARAQRGSPCR